jgi:hypothetical protein
LTRQLKAWSQKRSSRLPLLAKSSSWEISNNLGPSIKTKWA